MVERKALLILAIATLAVAYVSEALVHTFETVAKSFGWSELFIGLLSLQLLEMQRNMHLQLLWLIKIK